MPSSEVMHKWATGRLHSGGQNGPVVKSRAQAIAIAASERDKEKQNGGVYPETPHPLDRLRAKKRTPR